MSTSKHDRPKPIPVERDAAPASGPDAAQTQQHRESVSDLEMAALEAALDTPITVRESEVTPRDTLP